MTQNLNRTGTDRQIRVLTEEETRMIAGGRKAGENPLDYLVVKMKEAIITGVSP